MEMVKICVFYMRIFCMSLARAAYFNKSSGISVAGHTGGEIMPSVGLKTLHEHTLKSPLCLEWQCTT